MLKERERAIVDYLRHIAPSLNVNQGIKTREIADACGLGIYATRYILLKLTRLGYASLFSEVRGRDALWMPVFKNKRDNCGTMIDGSQ